jgi:hypothetical protein
MKYRQAAMPVRLRVTAMDLTDAFRLTENDIEVSNG